MAGKFIVFYGINNLGKTTQAKLLVEKIKQNGYQAEYLKYGIYDLAPSGHLLNDYLRGNNSYSLSPREYQLIHVMNRYQYQPKLLEKLRNGINIVAEDYVGTGLAWGIGAGVDENFLRYINNDLCKENLAFLFCGRRFEEAKENGHIHEENDALMEKVRLIHDQLGEEFGWKKVDANQKITEIAEFIWQECQKLLKSK